MYHTQQFCVAANRPEVQSQGLVSDSDLRYLKCAVSGLRAGWATFEQVRNALQSLFIEGEIRGIVHGRACVDGITVVGISPTDGEDVEDGEWRYSSVDGTQYSESKVEKVKFTATIAAEDDEMDKQLKECWNDEIDVVDKGGKVLIAGGKRRSALLLHDLPSGIRPNTLHYVM